MTNYFLISQLLVGCAFISDIASFQFKDRAVILSLLMISTVLMGIHFFLLSSNSAGALMFLAALRFAVAYFSRSKGWIWVFSALAMSLLMFTYKGPLNILALVAFFLMSVASFQSSDKTLRKWMMCGTTIWILHNILVGSPAAVLLECFFLASNLLGFWRFYLRAI